MSALTPVRRVIEIVISGLVGVVIALATPAGAANPIRLTTDPAIVYKNHDPGRWPTESWFFSLVVADAKNRSEIRPVKAELEVYAGTTLCQTVTLSEETLKRMKATSYRVTPETDSLSLTRRFTLDEIFDLRLRFHANPTAWEADRVRVILTLKVPGGGHTTETLDVPIRAYAQKTALIFPLKGPSIITQGQMNNFGHAGHSNQFAIDIMALDPQYAAMVDGKVGNDQYAAWGHDVIAPAAGRVVYARNDVPDNPPDTDPATVFSKVAEPIMATAGNCVVIDHGNGEFSALMHMQRGSVTVAVGSDVKQGQVIGRLGCSGDAFGPHLHYQLQDGPELFRACSLPVKFDNLPGADLSRGVYLTPK
jgi:hypothetical protein